MSRRRPGTAGSVRCSSAVGALRVRPGSRPGSAREWFEAYNTRRNEEAWRVQEWRNTVNTYKRREWEAQYYNAIAQPRKKISDEEEWERKEEKRQRLEERRARLRTLLREDEQQQREEREQRYRETRHPASHRHLVCPEVDMLRGRLEDLKKKNQEERKKLSETLSYEAWRKSNPRVRQMESERFHHFVQDAWVSQRQWKADERERRAHEERQKEREAEEIRQCAEEEEMKVEEERLSKQAEWKVQLEAQIEQIKERENKEEALAAEEVALEKERLRLHEISQRRARMQELRQRKDLELFWARQYQLKLKKRAADIQQELVEDQAIVEDLLRGLPPEPLNTQVLCPPSPSTPRYCAPPPPTPSLNTQYCVPPLNPGTVPPPQHPGTVPPPPNTQVLCPLNTLTQHPGTVPPPPTPRYCAPSTPSLNTQMKQRRSEAEWMRAVLGEQRRLEVLREKEYELLFSEEAERMWQRRQGEWDKEQKARDKLMMEVLQGLQKQIQSKSSQNTKDRDMLEAEKSVLQRSITETRERLHGLEAQEAERRHRLRGGAALAKPSEGVAVEAAAVRRERLEEERRLEDHRREIGRLEHEMQQLWGPHYAPPVRHYTPPTPCVASGSIGCIM
ncbi:Trichoplein keratin filament-binding protein [Chionoecetes opilio]|uniref:Trichoplein keratin filament-binding protein n=1 Tax=Chionoecetes opilio TaxID=41210 RepID=A0A8J4YWX2_CHIOP|nr:Trichoplein keratin filament-binding protein [Chionoecetes opilio]